MLQDQTLPVVPEGTFPPKLTLAMAYVPYQCWEAPYPANEALEAGTAFPSLDKPFFIEKGGRSDERDAAAVFGSNGKG